DQPLEDLIVPNDPGTAPLPPVPPALPAAPQVDRPPQLPPIPAGMLAPEARPPARPEAVMH
ncbi:MAG: autotransporter outer membrane beta-barrel domain-containing protein, partial [Polaromonas sp.]